MSRKLNDSDDEDEEVSNYYEEDDDSSRKVHIKELDLASLSPLHVNDTKGGSKYVIIGRPGTGKSTLIEAIMYAKKHIIPVMTVYSGTEDSNGFFSKRIPSTFIRNGLDIGDLSSVENFKKRQKIARKFLEPRGDNPWSFFIMDDCSSDPKFLKNLYFKAPIKMEDIGVK